MAVVRRVWPSLRVYVAAVVLAGVGAVGLAVAIAVREGVQPDPLWLGLVLLAALVAAELMPVRVGEEEVMTVSLAYGAALVFVLPGYLAVVAVAAVTAGCDLLTGVQRMKAAFNAAMMALVVLAGTFVVRAGGVQHLGQEPLAAMDVVTLIGAFALMYAVNGVLVGIVLSLALGSPLMGGLLEDLRRALRSDGVLLVQAPVLVIVGRGDPWLLPFAMAATAVVLYATRTAAEQREEALHDPLTGAANRRLFDRALQDAIHNSRAGSKPAMVLVDLDGFKAVNDEVGHHAGDLVLVAVADALRDVAPAGTLVARLGGDEFGVLLPQVSSLSQAWAVAQPVASSFPISVAIDDAILVQVRASVGVAVANGDGVDGLFRAADRAMYRAKRTGLAVAVASGEEGLSA